MKFNVAIAKYAAHENSMAWEAVCAALHEKTLIHKNLPLSTEGNREVWAEIRYQRIINDNNIEVFPCNKELL